MALTDRLSDQATKQALPDLDLPLAGDDERDAGTSRGQKRAARVPGLIGRSGGGYARVSPRTLSRMVPLWVPIGCVVVGAVVVLVVRFVA